MRKHCSLWLVVALLPILLFAAGCNDTNADALAENGELTKTASEKCGGCPDAEHCQTASADAAGCDPAKCADTEHAEKCAGGEKCTPENCQNCPEKGKCEHAKAETTGKKHAGCSSGKKCGSH